MSPFGLKNPGLRMIVSLQNGEALRLDVGSRIPVEGGNDVTTGDQAPVLKLDAVQAEGLRKRPLDLMEKQAVSLDPEQDRDPGRLEGKRLAAEKKGDQMEADGRGGPF